MWCRESHLATLTRPCRSARPGPEVSDPLQAVVDVLAIPELAFSLVTIGLLGVMLWLATPGMAGSGAAGAALLVAASGGMAAIPVTAGGIVLLGLAAASLCFEVRYMPGVGLYAIGGWFALTLSGFFLSGMWSGAHPAVVLPETLCDTRSSKLLIRGRHYPRLTPPPRVSAGGGRVRSGRGPVRHTPFSGCGTGGRGASRRTSR
jgi:hypothetical protein